jgi:hypothetical protein
MSKVQEFISKNKFPEERFLPVKGFEGRFWISDHGRIVSNDHRKNTIKFLSPHLDRLGYYASQLRMKPANRKCRVHQLVGEHFCEMKDAGVRMTWNHKDGIKTNNHYSNLEYITARDNCHHSVSTGLLNIKGENHHNAKMDNETVMLIRALRKEGINYNQIGKIVGISRKQATDICKGKAWLHVT